MRIVAAASVMLLILVCDSDAGPQPYDRVMQTDDPVLWWSFEGDQKAAIVNRTSAEVQAAQVIKSVRFQKSGPQPKNSDLFSASNSGIRIDSAGGHLRIVDPGDDSPLDFTAGNEITLEAWVNPTAVSKNAIPYVISKGRTFRDGRPKDNQNYSLRLRPIDGRLRVCFLFRGTDDSGKQDWYRWNSNGGFATASGWHHIAVTYRFGQKTDPVAYIDGQPSTGFWDMNGVNTATPVSDNDDLWIGSAMGGASTSTLIGGIDEVAIYKRKLSHAEIRRRIRTRPPMPPLPEAAPPKDRVLVEVFENIPITTKWNFTPDSVTDSYDAPAFTFTQVANRYGSGGIQADRSRPFMIRATSRIALTDGEYQFLLRARNGARLFINGQQVLETPFHTTSSSAHQELKDRDLITGVPIRQLQTGDNERTATVHLDDGLHEFRVELYLGGSGDKRPETGETSLSVRPAEAASDQSFTLVSPQAGWQIPLTEDGWDRFTDLNRDYYRHLNADRRRIASRADDQWWDRRHRMVKNIVEQKPALKTPELPAGYEGHNPIDYFIASGLKEKGVAQQPLTSDEEFLRRITLDLSGVIPTREQIAAFNADRSADRRAKVIQRLLEDDAWAEHWVSYWQDVLAENPNIVNPTLNNTGPFRWWIYESFLDRKPMDRFVTELIAMRGSERFGAPRGFSVASQNDAPMAAKALIVSQAFLGIDLKCARCHDAPFSDRTQEDLFNVAALLNRGPQAVPKTSTVPTNGESDSLIIEINLKPGQKVAPEWPFDDLLDRRPDPHLVRDPKDARESLAATITSPGNARFAQVMVNRLWQRYMGRGLVEPIDDWDASEVSHPELLDWLAREFVTSGYDLSHVASLIVSSRTYQSKPAIELDPELFAAPLQRRMSAEQIVDSIFLAAGKRFRAGELNIDADGSRALKNSLNLGRPWRAWQFTSMSNERDRPSLSLPLAQPFVTTLESFGWRSSRQNPVTVREDSVTVLQPAILSNGILARRFTRMSEDSAFTRFALEAKSLDEYITAVYHQTLTREPTAVERSTMRELLADGFETRVRTGVPLAPRFRARSTGVSWSNHLKPIANDRQIALQAEVAKGDPPTNRLQADWRLRAEDMLWAILNSPEFLFVP